MESQHWHDVKVVLTYLDHIKTFAEIQSHLEMEEERLKVFGTPNLALVSKGNRPKGNKHGRGRQAKKGSFLPQKGRPKAGIAKKQKAKGNGGINIGRVKCYNCGKKGHYAWDYPEPQRIPFSTYSVDLYVCFHALVANSFPNWIVDMGASKHIVRDRAGFVNFHWYPVGLQTVMLGNRSK